jgi:hypothetical protein
LTVALANAVKRCPAEMDGVIANTIKTKSDSLPAAIGAIDPFSPDDRDLHSTCATLPLVARMHATPILKERATDALAHGCKGVP